MTFRNEVSGEYLFYLVNFKATSPGVVSTIELVSTVRRTALATVQVENPLTTATCLTTDCKCLDISAPPQHTVPGQSKVGAEYIYFRYFGKNTAVCSQTNCNWHSLCVHVSPLFRALWALSTFPCAQASLQPGWLCLVMIWATSTTICFSKLCLHRKRKPSTSALLWAAATLFLLSSPTTPATKLSTHAR